MKNKYRSVGRIALAGCVVLLGGFICVRHFSDRAEEDRPSENSEQRLSSTAGTMQDSRKPYVHIDKPVSTKKQLGGMGGSGTELADVVDDIREAVAAEHRERIMRTISNSLASPGMNQMIEKQQRVLVADKYRDLIESYGLSDAEAEYFLDLLTARQMIQVEMGMKLMTGILSEEEKRAMAQRVGAGMDGINREIEYFLNNADDGEYFKYYERTEGERSAVESLRAELSQTGMPMGGALDEQIVAIMYEEMSHYPFTVRFEESDQSDFSRFTDENIGRFVEEMGALGDPVIDRVSQVLSADQLAVFERAYDSYVEAHEQRLRMIQQFFNPAQ